MYIRSLRMCSLLKKKKSSDTVSIATLYGHLEEK